jgi:predicted dehydrogenase
MALGFSDLGRMIDAAKTTHSKLMIAHCIRFWPAYQEACAVVKGGSVGKLLTAHFRRRAAFPGWANWAHQESQGGVILDLAIHDIDFAIQLAGRPTAVSAIGASRLDQGLDCCLATLHIGDIAVTCEASWCFRGTYPFSMDFTAYCAEGALCYDSSQGEQLRIHHADGSSSICPVAGSDAYWSEIDYFIRCIEEGQEPRRSPIEESALAVRLAILVAEARRTGAKSFVQ